MSHGIGDVFRQDRITLQEKKEEERRQAELAKKAEKQAEERKAEARRIVEMEVKKEMQEQLQKKTSELDDGNFEIPVVIDNEDPEAEYEGWKVRELTRLKRDRDERESYVQYNRCYCGLSLVPDGSLGISMEVCSACLYMEGVSNTCSHFSINDGLRRV